MVRVVKIYICDMIMNSISFQENDYVVNSKSDKTKRGVGFRLASRLASQQF